MILSISKYTHFLIIIGIAVFVSSCDTSVEDDLVTVRYQVSNSIGGTVGIEYVDEYSIRGGSQSIEPIWSHEFRIKESSQILYLSTFNVHEGQVTAEIFVDGKLMSSHSNTDSLRYRRSSIIWSKKSGTVGYSARGENTSAPMIKLPNGTNTSLTPYITRGDYIWSYLEVDSIENAPISLSISRPALSEGRSCVDLSLFYIPEGHILGSPFYLDEVQQCTYGPVDLRVEAIIPGS